MWQTWVIIVIILLITTLRHPSSLIIYFFIASIITFISSFFLNNLLLTIFIFLFSATCIGLLCSKHLLQFNHLPQLYCDNSNILLSQTGTVIKPISLHPFSTGLVYINNETWIATSHTALTKGTIVQVVEIQGLRLHVIPFSKP